MDFIKFVNKISSNFFDINSQKYSSQFSRTRLQPLQGHLKVFIIHKKAKHENKCHPRAPNSQKDKKWNKN